MKKRDSERRKTDPPRGLLRNPTDAPDIVHQRFHAADDLDPYVEHIWTVRWDLDEPREVSSLPHPSVHWVLVDDEGSYIGGPSRGRFTRVLEGRSEVFAVKFRPAGFRTFTQGPVSELVDTRVSPEEIFGPETRPLIDAVRTAGTNPHRIALVEEFLRSRLGALDPEVPRVSELVYRIAREPGLVKVQEVAAASGIGVRTLQRLFAEYVGVSPKWVIQRYRLHEAASRLAEGPIDHTDLALGLGYSDQAHFIRDFKRVVGVTPAEYVRDVDP